MPRDLRRPFRWPAARRQTARRPRRRIRSRAPQSCRALRPLTAGQVAGLPGSTGPFRPARRDGGIGGIKVALDAVVPCLGSRVRPRRVPARRELFLPPHGRGRTSCRRSVHCDHADRLDRPRDLFDQHDTCTAAESRGHLAAPVPLRQLRSRRGVSTVGGSESRFVLRPMDADRINADPVSERLAARSGHVPKSRREQMRAFQAPGDGQVSSEVRYRPRIGCGAQPLRA